MKYPNFDLPPGYTPSDVAKWLWAYFVGPLAGACLGAVLHKTHAKCVKKGGDVDYEAVSTD